MAREGDPGVKEEALLIASRDSPGVGNLPKVLGFFGVASRRLTASEFLADDSYKSSAKIRLLCSSDTFSEILTKLEQQPEGMRRLQECVHSAFVHAGDDVAVLQSLLRRLAGDDAAAVATLDGSHKDFFVSDTVDLAGPMSGLRIKGSDSTAATAFVFRSSGGVAINIISVNHGAVLLKLRYQKVTVFLFAGTKIIDIEAALTTGFFNIRDHVLAALPIVLYIKWAFPETCWKAAETNACLIIDDPVLKPTHGFVDFRELLSLMKRRRFCTNIAFIPWNWRRSDPQVVRMFIENPNHYSISVHGCDHTKAEFGSGDREYLSWKVRQALKRMADHESRTGIHHDRVMVFPQGVFSEAAMSALKRTDIIASVNNDTISSDPHPRPVTISDVWDVAIMAYSSFPLFTRRYPWAGVENFAFDSLLGKPAIIVVHHDYCSDRCKQLADFVDLLNALKCSLAWRSLAEVVRRTYRSREVSLGLVEVEMYGSELRLENQSDAAKRFIIRKRETDPSLLRGVSAGSRQLSWSSSGDRVEFELELKPAESAMVRIHFHDLSATAQRRESLPFRARIMLRRYYCEFRDNYLVKYQLGLRSRRNGDRAQMEEPPAYIVSSGSNRQAQTQGHPLKAADPLPDRVSIALTSFVQWLGKYGETSWDHQSFFAGPVGSRAKSLYYRSRTLGTAAVAPMILCEALVPSGRRLFHHPLRFPIADAHYAMGFSFLYQATQNRAYLERATHFLDELKKSRCEDFKEYCWGYPFDWVTRGGTIKKQTPLITTTPYVYEAFLQVHQLAPRDEWRRILESIVRHVFNDIKDFETSPTASSCSYTPFGEGGVINAAAYRAFLLTSASQVFSNDDYWKIAERNLNFVLQNQNPDGSWYYAVDGVRDFVDHFHTCFVMKALAKIHTLTGHEACGEALAKGVDYYQKNLFHEDGLPKPFSKAPRLTVYKRELYDCAECINSCLLLRDRFPKMETTLEMVVEGTLKDWIKPDGSFRSRRLHLGWDNVPMHRWGQSQMFRSLAYYFCDASRQTRGRANVCGEADDNSNTTRAAVSVRSIR